MVIAAIALQGLTSASNPQNHYKKTCILICRNNKRSLNKLLYCIITSIVAFNLLCYICVVRSIED